MAGQDSINPRHVSRGIHAPEYIPWYVSAEQVISCRKTAKRYSPGFHSRAGLKYCFCALGSELAALGLAGVAVKAGVRSAIATLWFVDDEATSLVIREFYRQMKTHGMSKAGALQNAQKKMIAQRRFWHPIYWDPFLLIGNWM
ncbi:MAG: CHAT domain-containing protein [Desulfobacteraceae bacterium]|nr:CHAT domain-containing protein [Desulfobacteraceae bacterium]